MPPVNVTPTRILHSLLGEQKFIIQVRNHIIKHGIKNDLGFVFKSVEVMLFFH